MLDTLHPLLSMPRLRPLYCHERVKPKSPIQAINIASPADKMKSFQILSSP